ncbi:MAG: DUF3617 domain-containing protein [Pseudomonadota bacterium]|nr:DUF3617 domain-containing protein [Pseudomonadota bacterium]
MTVRLLAAAAALIGLCACGQGKEGAEMSAEDVAKELAAVQIDPGEWQATTQILSATGPLPKAALDQMVGQRSSVNNCITPTQAARPSANFLAAQQGSDCTYRDFQMRGGKLAGTMTCSGGQIPGDMVTRMEGDYGRQSYDMVMDMETAGLPGGASLKIKARTQGRRVGECAATS